jgi:predicted nucleic acid-binding protein
MRSFFDTNILVYLFDDDAPDKKLRAQSLLEKETAAGRALLSTQVFQEFYVTVTQKLTVPLSSDNAEEVIRRLMALPHVEINSRHILGAIQKSQKFRLSFWDALIIEAAITGGADVLFTEDLQHGQVIEQLKIQNPFADSTP